MAIHLVRFVHDGRVRWGVAQAEGIAPLSREYPTTGALITSGGDDVRAAAAAAPSIRPGAVWLLSPVTAPARVICQGANYRQHMIESGLDPDQKRFNMFFEKSDASIHGPSGAIVRPAHVRLLDYEIELAIVFKKAISGPVQVTAATLHEHVFGITIANDVSARDVQLPQTQFFKGKSYRTFCPLGPRLAVLEPGEIDQLDRLRLLLEVNGAVRQDDTTANLVHRPAETITELSTFSDVSPGDVLLTGTPSGCALRVPPRIVRSLMQLVLTEPALWSAFTRAQSRRREYLVPGDVVRSTIRSADGTIDLGAQEHLVEGAPA